MTMHWFNQFFLSKTVSVEINGYIDVHTLSFITDKLSTEMLYNLGIYLLLEYCNYSSM